MALLINSWRKSMADQHRATAEHWDLIGRMCHRAEFSCLVELRDRIEALEAAAQPNHPAKPDGSLVERVARTLAGPNDDAELWMLDARAAIREAAAWLSEQEGYGHGWGIRLEQEAER